MKNKGLTLIEIIVAMVLLALVIGSLANVFAQAKRYILHSRLRMTGGELGKLFLDPLQMNVSQEQWATSCLNNTTNCPNNQTVAIEIGQNYWRNYTANYTSTPGAYPNLTRVVVNITWNETSP